MKKIIYLISSVFCDTVLLKIEEKSIYESDKEFLDINEINEFAKLSCIAAKIIDSNLTESILTLLKPYEVDYMVYKNKDAVMALIDVIEGEKISENISEKEGDDDKEKKEKKQDNKKVHQDKKEENSELVENFRQILAEIDTEQIPVKSKSTIQMHDDVWIFDDFVFITKDNKIIVPKGAKAIYGEDSSKKFSNDASEKRMLYINSDNVVNETLEFDSISGVCQFLLNKKVNGWTSFKNLEGKFLTEYR